MNPTDPHGSAGIDQADIRFLVEKNADGIIVLDEDGVVLFGNPAAEQIFGRTPDVLIGSPIGVPLVGVGTTEITIHRPDGSFIDAEITVVTTTWERRPALLASLRDISARKAVEERTRQAAKMEAVGRLTAGVAHDFNNLLTVVLGNLDNAKRQSIAADGALARALDNAMRGAQRAAALTERLLAFARKKPLEPEVIEANQVVRAMSDLLQRTLGERINVRTVLHPNACRIETDPTELEAAILNLAVNARDAMPDGGDLLIETANVELDSAYAAANPDVMPGSHVLIAISDTGTGMAAEVLKNVFEPFFTTKPDGRGTGLGLSQVYGFVRQTGGHVKLYSEPGVGTSAKIYFPVTLDLPHAHPVVEGPKRTEQVPRARDGETILAVEDDEDVRAYAVACLTDLGYRVFEAPDAAVALQIMEREHAINLLFTDLGLPGGMDGKELADRVRAARPGVGILITSAYAGSALIHEGRLDPAVELLSKPFTIAALAARIRGILDRRDHVTKATRVLVVDDEVLLRMLLVDAVEQDGLQAEEAGSFHEAVAKMQGLDGELAAAIVDLGLPDRPGDELVAHIRAVRPTLPIILATGYASDDVRRRFGADAYLAIITKPFDPEKLMTALAGFGVRTRPPPRN